MMSSIVFFLHYYLPAILKRNEKKGVDTNARELVNLHPSFSSRFPRDVIDKARINSWNSMEPSCKSKQLNQSEDNN